MKQEKKSTRGVCQDVPCYEAQLRGLLWNYNMRKYELECLIKKRDERNNAKNST